MRLVADERADQDDVGLGGRQKRDESLLGRDAAVEHGERVVDARRHLRLYGDDRVGPGRIRRHRAPCGRAGQVRERTSPVEGSHLLAGIEVPRVVARLPEQQERMPELLVSDLLAGRQADAGHAA